MAEGKFEKGTSIVSNKIETTDSLYASVIAKISDKDYNKEKVAVFNISLENSKGVKIQPDGKVKITMPKPFESENGYVTFHVKDDESVESLVTTVSGTNIIFETTSFSYFLVAGNFVTNDPGSSDNPPVSTPTITYSKSSLNDSLAHAYNGAAVFVSKNDIIVDGVPLNEVTDENVLSKISYVWRDKNTKAIVTPDVDITITGEKYPFGKDNQLVGDEFAGPCVVGEYEFVLSYDGIQKIVVDASITSSSFKKISTIDELNTTTAPTIFGELNYYTIVGFVDGKMYVMQMPKDATSTTDLNVDAEARLVNVEEDGSVILGDKYDFAFANMRYFHDTWKYYPETSYVKEDLLTDFTTGYYGSRTGVVGLAEPIIYRTGWTRLSGDRIVRERGVNIGANYGNLTIFGDDGAVTIYAPRKGETVNNALRLVKDGDKYVFTGKDASTDTRESYPIYIYKMNISSDTNERYEFVGNLSKRYDGEAVNFNVHKNLIIETENGEDIGGMLKMGTVRFVFTDLKDNFVMYGDIQDDNVVGPKDVGQYKLLIQIQEKGKDGLEWVDKATLHQFEIRSAS